MTPVKPWYQSKTVWVNSLIVLLAALDALRVLPYVPSDWAATALALGGVLNIILRLVTSSGIAGFAPVPLGEQPAYRAAHDASGDPAPMRAVPAPQDAPPEDAGAPSLAEQIAADNGITLPKDSE